LGVALKLTLEPKQGRNEPPRAPSTPRAAELPGEAVDQPLKPVLEDPDVEVKEESDVAARELEVRQQLRFVKRGQTAHGLDFEDDLVLDQDVEAIPAVDEESVVADGLWLLALDMETASSQLEAQARLVGRLKEPRPERTVDLDCRSDDLLRKRIQLGGISAFSVLSAVHPRLSPGPEHYAITPTARDQGVVSRAGRAINPCNLSQFQMDTHDESRLSLRVVEVTFEPT